MYRTKTTGNYIYRMVPTTYLKTGNYIYRMVPTTYLKTGNYIYRMVPILNKRRDTDAAHISCKYQIIKVSTRVIVSGWLDVLGQ